MKKILFLSFAVLAITFSACESDEPTNENTEQQDPNTEDPNTEDPNTEDPNTEDPNTEDPNTEEETYEDGVYVMSATPTSVQLGDTVTFTIVGNDVADKMWFMCSDALGVCVVADFVDGEYKMAMTSSGALDYKANYIDSETKETIYTNAVYIDVAEEETYEDGVYVMSATPTTVQLGDTVTFTIEGNDVSDKMWFMCSDVLGVCVVANFVDGEYKMAMTNSGNIDYKANYFDSDTRETIYTNAVYIDITE